MKQYFNTEGNARLLHSVHYYYLVYNNHRNTACGSTLVVNVSGMNAIISLKNIAPTDIESGQGIEITLRETGINPVEMLVAPYSIRNVQTHCILLINNISLTL